jgi:hypothetical protein
VGRKKDVEDRLKKAEVEFLILKVGIDKMNVFFGKKACVDVIAQIGKEKLKMYSPEEDFLLGVMLGYDIEKQCKRYLSLRDKRKVEYKKTA